MISLGTVENIRILDNGGISLALQGEKGQILELYSPEQRVLLREAFEKVAGVTATKDIIGLLFYWESVDGVSLPTHCLGTLRASPITIDTRGDGEKELHRLIGEKVSGLSHLARLAAGDVQFVSKAGRIVGIEIKRDDLLSSIETGLLASELALLVETCHYPYLLCPSLNQAMDKVRKIGVNLRDRKFYDRALDSCSLAGVRIKVTDTTRNDLLAGIILDMFDYFNQEDHDYPQTRLKSWLSTKEKIDPAMRMLLGVDGYDEVRAAAALEQFRTPRAWFGASLSERQRVKGIGKVLAESVDEALDWVYVPREKQPL